jgi:hypothetical protein
MTAAWECKKGTGAFGKFGIPGTIRSSRLRENNQGMVDAVKAG